jgi:hypothetical protein
MRTKTKTEKFTFVFDKETSSLLLKLVELTDMSQVKIVTRALQNFANKKGVE